jgi:DNA-binding Xre family transcriptional regulator
MSIDKGKIKDMIEININILLATKKMKKSELSLAMGYSQRYVSNLFAEDRGILSIETAYKICSVLECNISDIYPKLENI